MSSVRQLHSEIWQFTCFWPFQAPELEKKGILTLLSKLDILETIKYNKNLHIPVKMRGQCALCDH